MPYRANLRDSIASLPSDVQAHILQLEKDSQMLADLFPPDPGEDLKLSGLVGQSLMTYVSSGDVASSHRRKQIAGKLCDFFERLNATLVYHSSRFIE